MKGVCVMKRFVPLLLVLALLLPGAAYAGAPLDTVKARVNEFLKVLRDPALKDNLEEQKQKLWDVALELFDFKALSMRSLGKTWKDMSDKQQQEFVDLFSKLLERTYMEKIRDYNDETVVFDNETMLGDDRAEVSTKIVTQSKEIPILYRLYNRSGEWRVYDVLIENVSMVKNYRTQFTEFLTKKNVDDLLEHLRQKTSERAEQSLAPFQNKAGLT